MSRMGTVTVKIPLVTWRDGRPRFWPSKAQRALGYGGEDLRHGASGPWFTLDEAIAWSETRQAEIDGKRAAIAAGETTVRKAANDVRRARMGAGVTVAELFTAFRDTNPRMLGIAVVSGRKLRKPLSAGTVRFYKGAIAQLEQFDGGFVWASGADELTGKALAGILDKYEAAHGLSQTRALRATVSAVYAWGMSKAGKYRVRRNPVAELEETLPVLDPRVRYGTVPEMLHFIATADALGFFDIGDAITLGLFTGQRQNDRLALRDTQISDAGILFQQSKKGGQPLLIPPIAPLRARLEAMAERRREWRVNYGEVLLDERRRRPWLDRHHYGKVFAVIRHAAAFGTLETIVNRKKETVVTPVAERLLGGVSGVDAANAAIAASMRAAGLTPMPSLATFHDQDLRDTAVTWMALAGLDKWQIASITGHSLVTIDSILKHYFGAHPDLARAGMEKLETYWKKVVG